MAVAELLRQARTRRGLTLEQLASETKIGRDRLAAFERDGLPPDGSFYARARLRTYADALGIDHRVVLAQLDQELLAAAPVPAPQPAAPAPRRLRLRGIALTAGCVVLLGVLVGPWLTPAPQPARHASAVPPARSDPTPSSPPPIEDSRVPPAVASVTTPVTVERASLPVETSGVLPPPVETTLVIVTKPEGARVTVDGIGWGTTPVTIANVSEGLRRIRVTSDGYVAAERAIEIQSDRLNRITVQLKPLAPVVQDAP